MFDTKAVLVSDVHIITAYKGSRSGAALSLGDWPAPTGEGPSTTYRSSLIGPHIQSGCSVQGQQAQAVTLLTFIREILDPNLSCETVYSDLELFHGFPQTLLTDEKVKQSHYRP
jgi:hypothetical protein